MTATNRPNNGGKRPGAGRPKGTKNKLSREVAARAMADGITPLEVIIRTMRAAYTDARDPLGKITNWDRAKEAVEFAGMAARFCHAAIQPIPAVPEIANQGERRLSELEYARRIAYVLRMGASRLPVTIDQERRAA